ncbi:MAG: hypothetical protein ABFS32_02745 [Bacteroidota bacterium]
MKKLIIVTFLVASIVTAAEAQFEEKMKKENVVEGIVYQDGKELHGYIKNIYYVKADGLSYFAPWKFQEYVVFYPKDVFENTEKLKRKHFELLKAKDCDGYKIDTLIYESVKYAHLEGVGVAMPKKMFLRKVLDDKISLFLFFKSPPPAMTSYDGQANVLKEAAKPYNIYRVKIEGKLKQVADMNIKKELADCSFVTEKEAKGEYKASQGDQESSKLLKLMKDAGNREESRFKAIADYNTNCSN